MERFQILASALTLAAVIDTKLDGLPRVEKLKSCIDDAVDVLDDEIRKEVGLAANTEILMLFDSLDFSRAEAGQGAILEIAMMFVRHLQALGVPTPPIDQLVNHYKRNR